MEVDISTMSPAALFWFCLGEDLALLIKTGTNKNCCKYNTKFD
jgi:hypothetical protein